MGVDVDEDDFEGFLAQLVNGDDLEGAALGIAKKVVASGSTDNLSDAQQTSLVLAVKEWLSNEYSDYAPGFVTTIEALPARPARSAPTRSRGARYTSRGP